MSVRTYFKPNGTDIHVDEQHISRLTEREVRELVFQLLIFGGHKIREEVKKKLADGGIDHIAKVIAEAPSAPTGDHAEKEE